MSIEMLKQNSEMLVEISRNYKIVLEKRKLASPSEAAQLDAQIKSFKSQFLYLLTAINKLVQQEKNAN